MSVYDLPRVLLMLFDCVVLRQTQKTWQIQTISAAAGTVTPLLAPRCSRCVLVWASTYPCWPTVVPSNPLQPLLLVVQQMGLKVLYSLQPRSRKLHSPMAILTLGRMTDMDPACTACLHCSVKLSLFTIWQLGDALLAGGKTCGLFFGRYCRPKVVLF